MINVLIGGGGIVGSGFAEVLRDAGEPVVRFHPPWTDPSEACAYIEDRLDEVLRESDDPVTVIWAAGIGGVSSNPADMAAERAALSALVDTLLADRSQRGPSRMVFASSAGALFGGHGPTPIDDASQPVPIAAFGFEKLDQEGICAQLGASDGWCVLAARLSNVYGLAAGRVPRRGLIDTAVRAVRTSTPMSIYVSPDSRRDYIFNVDAARSCLDLVASLPTGYHARIVAAGETISVASVIATVGAVARRRVPATFGDRPYSYLQPRTLWFQPAVPPIPRRATALPVAVNRLLHAPMSEGVPR